ncbi:small ribosomal subunit biogenesis GTPase RsgA [Legionella sp. CNM-4043-24]|uniref:small ribosomal subunit biogenesis GTPase RsgA n=1 Tax=Legionella sp. CNM-4043-24 TaxID=3421646 RepID=UPI00403AFFB9
MAKRQLNKQQTTRIQKKQSDYQQTAELNSERNENGLVITRFSRHAEVENSLGKRIICSIRPTIDSLVAGDRVIWQSVGDRQGVVVSCYPRQSVLGRPDKRHGIKPVAANISQLMIVVAAKPELTWSLLDSYLVMAENLGLQASIVLNKTDLPCNSLKQELQDSYEPLGYPVLFTCQNDFSGYDELHKALNNQTSVFVGQSGVGKSSLIAGILPHETKIQVGEISSQSSLGCHTTSNSRLYHLPTGGSIIDSPGVREFGLWRMPVADIIYGFREFRDMSFECKFRNCNHRDSPGCAIIQATRSNKLSKRRYDSLIKICDSAL